MAKAVREFILEALITSEYYAEDDSLKLLQRFSDQDLMILYLGLDSEKISKDVDNFLMLEMSDNYLELLNLLVSVNENITVQIIKFINDKYKHVALSEYTHLQHAMQNYLDDAEQKEHSTAKSVKIRSMTSIEQIRDKLSENENILIGDFLEIDMAKSADEVATSAAMISYLYESMQKSIIGKHQYGEFVKVNYSSDEKLAKRVVGLMDAGKLIPLAIYTVSGSQHSASYHIKQAEKVLKKISQDESYNRGVEAFLNLNKIVENEMASQVFAEEGANFKRKSEQIKLRIRAAQAHAEGLLDLKADAVLSRSYSILRECGYKANGKPIQAVAVFPPAITQEVGVGKDLCLAKLDAMLSVIVLKQITDNCRTSLFKAINFELSKVGCVVALGHVDVENFNLASNKKLYLENMIKTIPLVDALFLLQSSPKFAKIILAKLRDFHVIEVPPPAGLPLADDLDSANDVHFSRAFVEYRAPVNKKNNSALESIQKYLDRIKSIKRKHTSGHCKLSADYEKDSTDRIKLIEEMFAALLQTTKILPRGTKKHLSLQRNLLCEIYTLSIYSGVKLFIAADAEDPKAAKTELNLYVSELLKQSLPELWSKQIDKLEKVQVFQVTQGMLDNEIFIRLDLDSQDKNLTSLIHVVDVYSALMHFGCEAYLAYKGRPYRPFTIHPYYHSGERFNFVFGPASTSGNVGLVQVLAAAIGEKIQKNLHISSLGNRLQLYVDGEILHLNALIDIINGGEIESDDLALAFQLMFLFSSFDELRYARTRSFVDILEGILSSKKVDISLDKDFMLEYKRQLCQHQTDVNENASSRNMFLILYEVQNIFASYKLCPTASGLNAIVEKSENNLDVFNSVIVTFLCYMQLGDRKNNIIFVNYLFDSVFFKLLHEYLDKCFAQRKRLAETFDDKVIFKTDVVNLFNLIFSIRDNAIFNKLKFSLSKIDNLLMSLGSTYDYNRKSLIFFLLFWTECFANVNAVTFIKRGKVSGKNNERLLADLFCGVCNHEDVKQFSKKIGMPFSMTLYNFVMLFNVKLFHGYNELIDEGVVWILYRSLLETVLEEFQELVDNNSNADKVVPFINFYHAKIKPLRGTMPTHSISSSFTLQLLEQQDSKLDVIDCMAQCLHIK